jgi:phosphatidylethanolamine-binding protein (PEBP) family uncharacterized protein
MNISEKKLKSKTRKYRNSFHIFYGPIQVQGQQLSRLQTQEMPHMFFHTKKGKYYTILMYDLHSAKPTFLHFAAVNISAIDKLHPLVTYLPPTPPVTDTHYHVYMFELYEQPGFLTIKSPSTRVGFNPDTFVHNYKLRKVAQQGFYINPRA